MTQQPVTQNPNPKPVMEMLSLANTHSLKLTEAVVL
jgi:hypothetical protein